MSDDEAVQSEQLGSPAWAGEHLVLTGSCSWTERTLVEQADWYPRRTMSAEERLRYYAGQFPLTEIDSTYYAPPAEHQAAPVGGAHARRGFASTSRPTRCSPDTRRGPRSLWRDLREQLSPEDAAEKRNIYRQAPRGRRDGRGVAAVRARAPAAARGRPSRRGAVPVPAVVRAAP